MRELRKTGLSLWRIMKNKYQLTLRIFREVIQEYLRMFYPDICALIGVELAGVNKNTTRQFYGKFRARVALGLPPKKWTPI